MDRNLREKVLLKILPEGEFHQNGDEFVFRCPFCGDSKRDNKKRRFGYNIVKDSAHCFNCGIGFPNAFRNVVEKLTGKEMLDLVVSVMDGTEIIKTIDRCARNL